MPTVNYTSSTNNGNFVLHNLGSMLQYYTDRAAGSLSARDSIEQLQGLGLTVSTSNPFTNKTS